MVLLRKNNSSNLNSYFAFL